jgi:hypothetical protein
MTFVDGEAIDGRFIVNAITVNGRPRPVTVELLALNGPGCWG